MDSNQVVAPMLMQRTCDGGKSDMTEEQWASLIALKLQGQPTGFMGCGTTFQWYWGSGCVCPTCGRSFAITVSDRERFRARENNPRLYEREIEERIMRNLLMRLGSHR